MEETATRDPTKALWRARLESALRTTLACTIVGCTTLYGPEKLRQILTYPAFSYVTTILIVSDATLGDTIRGCWHVLYATLQVMIPSVLTLYVIGPERFTGGLAAVAVAVSCFVLALPEWTPLMAKRIAFGQTVIVYVGTVVHGAETGVLMQPLHVASSTALGALASVLAMLVPFPRLAYFEVKKSCRLYVENATKRLNLFVEAFTAQNKQASNDLIDQAKLISNIGQRNLQSIKDAQGGMLWEKPQMRFLENNRIDPGENFQDMETLIRGMEIALTSCTSFPVGMIDGGIREELLSRRGKIGLKLEQAKCIAPFDATTAPETKGETSDNSLWSSKAGARTHADSPAFFFLYCLELLQSESLTGRGPECMSGNTSGIEEMKDQKDQVTCCVGKAWSSSITKLSKKRWMFAIKCSLSLGFAVLFGLMYNKENGYWSGLTIAISFITGRQATFTVANARAQGTAMGSVYGVLCSFIFQRFVDLRFLSLLPWIIFTSFLRHSRMYGQAGATSAVIGALLILGRKNYGAPSEFAIARITEATIGLICFIVIESLLQPARAASLAKTELARSLVALRDCIENIVLNDGQKNQSFSMTFALRRKQKKFKSHVDKLEKFIVEAKWEPNFWFSPFRGTCFDKFLESLKKMNDLLLFIVYEMETISEASERLGIGEKELELINDDLDLFQEKVISSLKSFEEVISIKSLAVLEKEMKQKRISHDIELGKSQDSDAYKSLSVDEDEIMEIVGSFLQHSMEVTTQIDTHEGEEHLKSQMILCLSGLEFCISSIMRETTEIEKELKELITLENPTRNINLYQISRGINSLHTK